MTPGTALERARLESWPDEEIVRRAPTLDRPVFLVPVSLFRGRIFRRQEGRLSAFAYSVHDAPSDLKKLLTYRFNREDLLFNIGRVIDLPSFLSSHRGLGEARLARRLNNSLQRELAQEERAVWGPLLLPRRNDAANQCHPAPSMPAAY